MLRTASHRPLPTGVGAIILAFVLGVMLDLAGGIAATSAAAATVGDISATSASPSAEPTEEMTEEPTEEPTEEAPEETTEPDDTDVVVEDEGFPLWATILLIVLGIVLIAAIAYAATRDRDRRDRI